MCSWTSKNKLVRLACFDQALSADQAVNAELSAWTPLLFLYVATAQLYLSCLEARIFLNSVLFFNKTKIKSAVKHLEIMADTADENAPLLAEEQREFNEGPSIPTRIFYYPRTIRALNRIVLSLSLPAIALVIGCIVLSLLTRDRLVGALSAWALIVRSRLSAFKPPAC